MVNPNNVKMRVNEMLKAAGKINGVYDISDESKIRVVTEECGAGNTIVVRGRIKGQANFVNLKTITGQANETVTVSTYDEVEIECTVYQPLAQFIRVLASSFNEAGGSAIESIGVPSGSNLTDFDAFSFVSSDNTILISGNNSTKTIDLKVIGTLGDAFSDTFNATSNWGTPALGVYSISYPQSLHAKGTTPTIDVYELVVSQYIPVEVPMTIDLSGNVILQVSETPDLRFEGIVIIK
jgi:hypothetical protein